MEAARKKRRQLPDWYIEGSAPLPPAAEFYMAAFWDLHSCRQIGFSIGPIPWTAIKAYADFIGLPDDLTYVLTCVIRRMDSVYLEDVREQMEKQAEAARKPADSKSEGRA